MDADARERLDRLLLAVDALTEKVGRLEAAWDEYRAFLPEPGSIKGRIARRKIAAELEGWK